MANPIQDVSFAGAHLMVGGVSIDDFMDDANPIEFDDLEVSKVEYSCNGKMIRSSIPRAIFMSVTVIPGSPSDHGLQRLLKKYHNIQSGGDLDGQLSAYISTNGGSYSFSDGTMISGSPGVGSKGDGKMMGKTYTFAFMQMDSTTTGRRL